MFRLFGRAREPKSDVERANEYYRLKQFDKALDLVNSMIAQHPSVAMSQRFKGEVLFAMVRYRECIEAFTEAERIGGDGIEEVFFWRALAHANLGEREIAQQILQAYLALDAPDFAIAEKTRAALAAISRKPA